MKLEHGKFYRNGRGDIYGPMDERTPGHFLDQYGTGYYPDGRQWDHLPASTGNLVAEATPPKSPSLEGEKAS